MINIHPLWFLCILVRMLLASIVFYKKINIKILSILLGIMSIGFFYRGVVGSNNEVQIAKVFWHNTRFLHGLLYLCAFIALLNSNSKVATVFIVLDLIFSISYRVYTDQ